jgi:imidazolonepropionase-like amidohydrolase
MGATGTTVRYLADRAWTGDGRAITRAAVDVDLERGTILAVGGRDDLAPPAPGTRTTDLGDVTVLPGLIDSHVHIAFAASDDVVGDFLAERDAGPSDQVGGPLHRRAADGMARALTAGITTLRDLGTPAAIVRAVREDLAAGRLAGPALVTAAEPLTTPGGHCHFLSHEVPPDADPARAVDQALEAGADLVKVFASGGNLTPGSSALDRQYDQAFLTGVVQAAHRRGVGVAAHAFGIDSVRDAVAAGVDTIEHCACQTPDGPVVDDDLLRRMAAGGVAAAPTAGAGPAALLALDLDRVPAAIRPKVEAIRRSLPKALDLAKATVEAGVPLLAGTDAGIPERPTDTLVDAVIWFCAAEGLALTPAEALATATTTVADTCGLPDRGRLAPGLRADLLVVDGDPLARIDDLARTRLVVLAGHEVAGPRPAPPANGGG